MRLKKSWRIIKDVPRSVQVTAIASIRPNVRHVITAIANTIVQMTVPAGGNFPSISALCILKYRKIAVYSKCFRMG